MTDTNSISLGANSDVLAIVRGELLSRRRWVYRFVLVASCIVFAGVLSLWLTEPVPLPFRLHAAFAVLLAIASGWIVVTTWFLLRVNCPTAQDQIATAWMSLVACVAMFVLAFAITASRGAVGQVLAVCGVGVPFIGAAAVRLRAAYRRREELLKRLSELEADERSSSN